MERTLFRCELSAMAAASVNPWGVALTRVVRSRNYRADGADGAESALEDFCQWQKQHLTSSLNASSLGKISLLL